MPIPLQSAHPQTLRWKAARVTVVVAALALSLTACSSTVGMISAPAANTPACAAVQVRLPTQVDGGLNQRPTNAQSTAAWGSPVAITYHCGVAVPTVSTLPCFTLGSVNWLRDVRGNTVIYTTFGRTPAVQVIIDTRRATSNILQDINDAVGTLPTNSNTCLSPT